MVKAGRRIWAQVFDLDIISSKKRTCQLVVCKYCLFELMLNVSVNGSDLVGTLHPLFGCYPTLVCHDTQNVLHRYNQPSKPIRLICMDGVTKPFSLDRLRLERLTSN